MPPGTDSRWLLLLTPPLIAACTLSLLRSPMPAATQPEESATASFAAATSAMTTESPATTPASTPTDAVPAQPGQPIFCDDLRPPALFEAFKEAVVAADGVRLSSLVSPRHGMDARLLRDGRIVNYDREHAAALFESTYVVDWGTAPGSGLPVRGSFHDLLVPDLMDVLSKDYTLACNRIEVGGTTYSATWPYQGIDFYSAYYPGAADHGSMDWHTWLIGIHYVDNQPYLYAIMQFKWEP